MKKMAHAICVVFAVLFCGLAYADAQECSKSNYEYCSVCPGGAKLFPKDEWNAAQGFWSDQWGFAQCNCTSYVASKVNELWAKHGILDGFEPFGNRYGGPRWSHAGKWPGVAEGLGISVDDFPVEGDAAIWDCQGGESSCGSNGDYGHVAFVEKVNYTPGTIGVESIIVSEYNITAERFTRRTIRKGQSGSYYGKFPHRFIHLTFDRQLCVEQSSLCGKSKSPRDAALSGGWAGGLGGYGPGFGLTASGAPIPTYPDFVPLNVDILTTGGLETYIYGNLETHKVKAQFANVGDRDADSRPIEVHTYRSKGYKEDQHGDWVHVATNTIQGQNLKKDETHTETATIALKGLTPGIYNYVSCIDHPRTEQNNGGDHQEKHESNNCSTEAVFEVKAGVVNQPNVDLTISQVALNTNPVYAGYPMSASLWVRNIGTETPTATSRAAYYVSGPGTSNQWQLIADDEVLASELTPGRDQGESIKSPVVAPSIPGSYQLMACADYLNQVLETNKANNCLVIPFTIQTLPAPILSITKFQDEESCCTTNTGSRIKPNIWVKNSGPIAPATNVQVLYQVSSPVATGSQWVYIGYGIIEPRELPPGKTDEDYMEGSGFTIPKDNAWKLQWHQVRACIKPDGSAPSGDTAQGDICATYQRYSKK